MRDRIRVWFVKASVWTGIALFIALTVMAGEAKRQRADQAPNAGAESAQIAADTAGRISKGCEIIQTMGFSRCGHSVTRRVAAPAEAIGADFAQAQAYYDLWQIEVFSPERVTMIREIPLFCPMHRVLSVNEAGEIVLTHNVYGDGMAVDETFDRSIADFDEETQSRLLLGLGFDSREDAEAWLTAH